MRRAALLVLLLLGACASAEKDRDAFMDRPREISAAKDTGSCRPWFVSPERDWGEGSNKHSCWNLLWEVPTAIVAVPLFLGVVTAPVWVPIVLLK